MGDESLNGASTGGRSWGNTALEGAAPFRFLQSPGYQATFGQIFRCDGHRFSDAYRCSGTLFGQHA